MTPNEELNLEIPIGQECGPILEDIEVAIWNFELDNPGVRANYSNDAFRASIKIFISAITDKLMKLQEEEAMSSKIRMHMAEELGNKLRNLIKVYTNIDTREL